ncbi:hypothetical protein [Ktedonobacter robiniae]|uniref:hypothetical protein n=1 Tax=Ktedonobacter robiniae TaxID=2778365 RepID=UPI0019154569|nr:hypothetical protein [Ktedonobacter robiniae]
MSSHVERTTSHGENAAPQAQVLTSTRHAYRISIEEGSKWIVSDGSRRCIISVVARRATAR